ncbi:hypothetical protein [Actinomadura sp. RB99]|uniref:hypothetical protein n=1 Tax=Actinomadura sp. RB99 TaxID=2691577 RepID=UPI0019D618E7|nr:hypothetical protein [Actinomadura sp. RB99]
MAVDAAALSAALASPLLKEDATWLSNEPNQLELSVPCAAAPPPLMSCAQVSNPVGGLAENVSDEDAGGWLKVSAEETGEGSEKLGAEKESLEESMPNSCIRAPLARCRVRVERWCQTRRRALSADRSLSQSRTPSAASGFPVAPEEGRRGRDL